MDQEPESTSVTGGRAQVDVFEGVVPDADLAPRAVARPTRRLILCRMSCHEHAKRTGYA